MQKVVSVILNKVLGDFVEDQDTSSLNLDILKGNISLDNLKMKPGAFKSLGLPFAISYGKIADIFIDIPWMHLGERPILIEVSKVLLCLKPDFESSTVSKDDEYKIKKDRLESYEIIKNSIPGNVPSDKKKSFTQSLIDKIVNSIQFSINDIHVAIEYKDSVLGMTLEHLLIKSSDSNWRESLSQIAGQEFYYKILEISRLSLYWKLNHDSSKEPIDEKFLTRNIASEKRKAPDVFGSYILSPASMECKLKVKNGARRGPKYTVTLNLGTVSISLEKEHYSLLMLLLEEYSFWETAERFKAFVKPKVRPVDRESALLWWKYIFRCTSHLYAQDVGLIDWKKLIKHQRLKQKYLGAWKSFIAKPGKKIQQQLDTLERELDYDAIIFLRALAERQFEAEAGKKSGSLLNFFVSDSKFFAEDDLLKTIEEEQAMIDEITNQVSANSQMSSEEHFLNMSFKSESLQLKIKHPDVEDSFTVATITDLLLNLGMKGGAMRSKVAIDSVAVDYHQGDETFRILNGSSESDYTFWADVLIDPKSKDNSMKVAARLNGFELVYDHRYIFEVLGFVSDAQSLDPLEIESSVRKNLKQFKKYTKLKMINTIATHKPMLLSVLINGPIVIIPENPRKIHETSGFIVDLGYMYVHSLNRKRSSKRDRFDVEDLYDNMEVDAHGISIYLTDDLGEFFVRGTAGSKILHEMNTKLTLGMSIVPDNPDYPSVLVNGSLINLAGGITVRQYNAIMRMLESIFPAIEDSQEKKPEVKLYLKKYEDIISKKRTTVNYAIENLSFRIDKDSESPLMEILLRDVRNDIGIKLFGMDVSTHVGTFQVKDLYSPSGASLISADGMALDIAMFDRMIHSYNGIDMDLNVSVPNLNVEASQELSIELVEAFVPTEPSPKEEVQVDPIDPAGSVMTMSISTDAIKVSMLQGGKAVASTVIEGVKSKLLLKPDTMEVSGDLGVVSLDDSRDISIVRIADPTEFSLGLPHPLSEETAGIKLKVPKVEAVYIAKFLDEFFGYLFPVLDTMDPEKKKKAKKESVEVVTSAFDNENALEDFLEESKEDAVESTTDFESQYTGESEGESESESSDSSGSETTTGSGSYSDSESSESSETETRTTGESSEDTTQKPPEEHPVEAAKRVVSDFFALDIVVDSLDAFVPVSESEMDKGIRATVGRVECTNAREGDEDKIEVTVESTSAVQTDGFTFGMGELKFVMLAPNYVTDSPRMDMLITPEDTEVRIEAGFLRNLFEVLDKNILYKGPEEPSEPEDPSKMTMKIDMNTVSVAVSDLFSLKLLNTEVSLEMYKKMVMKAIVGNMVGVDTEYGGAVLTVSDELTADLTIDGDDMDISAKLGELLLTPRFKTIFRTLEFLDAFLVEPDKPEPEPEPSAGKMRIKAEIAKIGAEIEDNTEESQRIMQMSVENVEADMLLDGKKSDQQFSVGSVKVVRMSKEREVEKDVLLPFKVTAEIHGKEENMDVKVSLGSIDMILSFIDMQTILGVLEEVDKYMPAPESTGADAAGELEKSVDMDASDEKATSIISDIAKGSIASSFQVSAANLFGSMEEAKKVSDTLEVNFGGFQLLLVDDSFGPSRANPLIYFSVGKSQVFGEDFEKFKLGAALVIESRFYNVRYNLWEPLIEEFVLNFKINMSKGTKISVGTCGVINFNISNDLLMVLLDFLNKFEEKQKEVPTVYSHRLYVVNGFTFPLKIVEGPESSFILEPGESRPIDKKESGLKLKEIMDHPAAELEVLHNESSIKIRDDMEKYGYFLGSVELFKDVVYEFGSKFLHLKSKFELRNELGDDRISLIFDGKKVKHKEYLPLPLISDLDFELDVDGKLYTLEYVETGKKDVPAPIRRTRGKYRTTKFTTDDLMKKGHIYAHTTVDDKNFNFILLIKKETYQDVAEVNTLERVSIIARPILVVENLFPIPIDVTISRKVKSKFKELSTYNIPAGEEINVFGLEIQSREIHVTVTINGMTNAKPYNLPVNFSGKKVSTLALQSGFNISVERTRIQQAMRLVLFPKHVIINKTGISQLEYKDIHYTAPEGDFTLPDDYQKLVDSKPEIIIANSSSSATSVRIPGHTGWSKKIHLSVPNAGNRVSIPSKKGKLVYDLSVITQQGAGRYSRVMITTIFPGIFFINHLNDTVSLIYSGTGETTEIKPGERKAFFEKVPKNSVYSLRIPSLGISSKFGFSTVNEGLQLYKLLDKYSHEVLVKIRVKSEAGAIFVWLNPTDESEPKPYLIVNKTKYAIRFSQVESIRHFVEAYKSVGYTWDSLLDPKVITISWKTYSKEIRLSDIGKTSTWKIADKRLFTSVRNDGETTILTIATDNKVALSKMEYNRRIRSGMRRKLFTFNLEIRGLGVSVCDTTGKFSRELLYLRIFRTKFKYKDTTADETIFLAINDIQLDNNNGEPMFPVILEYDPETKGKERIVDKYSYYTLTDFEAPRDRVPVDVLKVSIVKSKLHDGVDYYSYLGVGLQKLVVKLDDTTLLSLLNYVESLPIDALLGEESKELFSGYDYNAFLESEDANVSSLKPSYFEFIQLNPISISIDFEMVDSSEEFSIVEKIGPIFGAFGSLLLRVHGLNIRLNALMITDSLISPDELSDRIARHYRFQVISQLYKVIGGVDAIGAPTELLGDIGSGIQSLFYEPIRGDVLNPKDIAAGVGRGTVALFKKTFEGVLGSASRIVGSVGSGVSSLTFDDEFKKKRTIKKTRSRNMHIGTGLLEGSKSIGSGIWGGVTGVVTKPIEGAKKDGVVGLLKGTGKGVVGLVAKPVVGVSDMATDIFDGLKGTAKLWDAHSLGRVRIPRRFHLGKYLKSYDPEESLKYWIYTSEVKGDSPSEVINTWKVYKDLIFVDTDKRVTILKNGVKMSVLKEDLSEVIVKKRTMIVKKNFGEVKVTFDKSEAEFIDELKEYFAGIGIEFKRV